MISNKVKPPIVGSVVWSYRPKPASVVTGGVNVKPLPKAKQTQVTGWNASLEIRIFVQIQLQQKEHAATMII